MIASFVAQGFKPLDAAKSAVYVHGHAADLAARDMADRSVLASNVIERLPESLSAIEGRAR